MIIAILMSLFASVASYSAEPIHNPALKNGETFLQRFDGSSTGDIANYITMVMQCTYNYSGCTIESAYNLFSSDSSPDGVCKALGKTRSIAVSIGNLSNPFGTAVTVNSDGNIIDIREKTKIAMPVSPKELKKYFKRAAASYSIWSSLQGARTFMYGYETPNVLVSITCE